MARYLLLAVAAALLVTCEAGYYRNRDAANQQGYYYKDANQQYYYQDRDANQQYYYQDRDANQQYYYQDRDANQQYYYQDRDANQQYYYQDRDANQQRYRYYQNRDANQQYYRNRDANQQYYYQDRDANQQYYYQDRDANQQRYGYYRYYYANQQDTSCVLEIAAPSRTFTICIKTDEICTNMSVPACGSTATDCKPIGEGNSALNAFRQVHPDIYAEECMESSGGHCLYTDVTYDTCSSAKAMENKICVKLTDGTERCSKIPELVKVAANDGDMPSNQMPTN